MCVSAFVLLVGRPPMESKKATRSTRVEKNRQGKTSQDMSRLTRHRKTRQGKTRRDQTREEKSREGKRGEERTGEGMRREERTRDKKSTTRGPRRIVTLVSGHSMLECLGHFVCVHQSDLALH